MSSSSCFNLDPRIRRTRQLLQDAIVKLLETKSFDDISVQDVTEAATVNRATFYDHYADKYALLEAVVTARFYALLSEREVEFDGTCDSGLVMLIRTVCDYLEASRPGQSACEETQMKMLIESTIVTLIKQVLQRGLAMHPPREGLSPAVVCSAASWAIYGSASEWVNSTDRVDADEIVSSIQKLVSPMLH